MKKEGRSYGSHGRSHHSHSGHHHHHQHYSFGGIAPPTLLGGIYTLQGSEDHVITHLNQTEVISAPMMPTMPMGVVMPMGTQMSV